MGQILSELERNKNIPNSPETQFPLPSLLLCNIMVISFLKWGFSEKYLSKSIVESSGILEWSHTSS